MSKTYDNPRVVIKVEGGNATVAENAAGVELHIIDYDTDGVAKKRLCKCHLAGANAPHVHVREP